jgi:hypothetical protein
MQTLIVWKHPSNQSVKVKCIMNSSGKALHYEVDWCGQRIAIETCESKAICHAKGFYDGLQAWMKRMASKK